MALSGGLGADEHGEVAVALEFHRTFLAFSPGGAFDIARKTETADFAPRLGVIEAARESRAIGLLEAGAHRALEIADVVMTIGVGVIGHLFRLDEIAGAQLFGRDRELDRAQASTSRSST